MPTRSELKITCLVNVGFATSFSSFSSSSDRSNVKFTHFLTFSMVFHYVKKNSFSKSLVALVHSSVLFVMSGAIQAD